MGNCKDCKYFERGTEQDYLTNVEESLPVGVCEKTININYWDDTFQVKEEIKDGFLGGDNVKVNENFGCIHFEQKE